MLQDWGLRAQDICDLSFNNLKWETNTIELLQKKTEKPIILPLLEDVRLAIIDYLKHARPECESTNAIFLRLIPPVGKLEAPTLHSIVTQNMRTAGIKIQDGKKHGPHDFRHVFCIHTLAKQVKDGVDLYACLPILSAYVGHSSVGATQRYVRFTAEAYPELIKKVSRTCAYIFPEVKR